MNLFLYFAGEWYKRQIAPEKEQRVILEDFHCQRILQKNTVCMDLFKADIRFSRKTHLVIDYMNLLITRITINNSKIDPQMR